MKSNRGFTAAELMIVLAVCGFFVAISAVACRSLTTGSETKKAATSDALTLVDELGWKASGISCADVDSDGDGYVSCTIALTNGVNEFVECRGAYSFGHGCRIPKLRVDRNVQ